MKRKIFSISRNLRYVVTGLLYISVLLAFVTRGSGFPWGGAVGDMIDDWLIRFLGWLGTAAVLFVAGLAYFIWRFNPVFKVPKLPVKDKGEMPEPADAGTAAGAGAKERRGRGYLSMRSSCRVNRIF